MSGTFNPHHVWLGIPPSEQPPNHYRLLGIAAFESDLDVIDHAADRQMSHVRTFQSGPHGSLSQQILNELSVARVCLLHPEKKAAYDEQLRGKLAAAVKTAIPVGKAVPMARPIEQPAAAIKTAAAIPRAVPTPTAQGTAPVVPTARPVAPANRQPAPAAVDVSDFGVDGNVGDDPTLDLNRLATSETPDFMLRKRRRLYRRGNPWQREIRLALTVGIAVITFAGLYWFYKFASSGEFGDWLQTTFTPPPVLSDAPAPIPTDSNQAAPVAEPSAPPPSADTPATTTSPGTTPPSSPSGTPDASAPPGAPGAAVPGNSAAPPGGPGTGGSSSPASTPPKAP